MKTIRRISQCLTPKQWADLGHDLVLFVSPVAAATFLALIALGAI